MDGQGDPEAGKPGRCLTMRARQSPPSERRASLYIEAAKFAPLRLGGRPLRSASPMHKSESACTGGHAFEPAASYSRGELESNSVLSMKPPPAAPISMSIGSRSPAAPLSISIYRHSISGQACHRGQHFLPCPHQRRVSIREMRLSDCSRVARLTTHSGAPTSLSIWASISSARLRRILSARQVR